MKVSLIIPTYNRAHLISDTLQSVLTQTYTNWECIVVDDGSTDTTKETLQEFINKDARFSYYTRPANRLKGANACRNYGLEKSSGAIINWLDSDDVLVKTHFETHVAQHENNNIDCAVSKAKNFVHDPEETNGMWSHIEPQQEPWKDMITGNISWATPSVSWKRQSLEARPFDEGLQSAQEWFFHVNKLIKGVSYSLIDKDTIRVRRHDNRVGTSVSAVKFQSIFKSRLHVFKLLRVKHLLDGNTEFYLINEMVKALRKLVFHRYVLVMIVSCVKLLQILPLSNFKAQLTRIIFVGVPVYFIFKKGEVLFKLKSAN